MTSPRNDSFHEPVLADAIVRLLATNRSGAYLDLTVGGGGHLERLAEAVDRDAHLYGLDRDVEAVTHATQRLRQYDAVRDIVHAAFSDIQSAVARFDVSTFDGILLDLGVSSHQIDDPSRGFAFQQDGPLDMRMDPTAGQSAADLINSADEKELAVIIRDYGEERQAARLAREIVRERQNGMIRTTAQLSEIVNRIAAGPHRIKSLARVFQAFRIVVNRELDELRTVLPAAVSILSPSGRLAVISYHSLEDRIVKRFFQAEARPPQEHRPGELVPHYPDPRLRLISRKPIRPEPSEQTRNPRARSARLRVAEKV
ncbi:16S rRNA (cytosine(1402)-N(4))-methyltransferase RsmH [candidate division GN15 bacterium]|nr:16S rRNA (cytosine(1402)-N(4))-methyltransferase RsmH [candidate division GN15 bacterium]